MTALQELLAEVAHEIAAEPIVFAVELVQFALLALGLKILASRVLVPRLHARKERVMADLEEASTADQRLAEGRRDADRLVAEARAAAKARAEAARNEAAAALEAAKGSIEEEAAGVLEQARETLRQEQEEAIRLVHAQLVDLVTIATRNVLEEALSESERRELVEKSVVASLDELEDVALAE